MGILRDNYNIGDDDQWSAWFVHDEFWQVLEGAVPMQTCTPTKSYTVKSIRLKLWRSGTPDPNAELRLAVVVLPTGNPADGYELWTNFGFKFNDVGINENGEWLTIDCGDYAFPIYEGTVYGLWLQWYNQTNDDQIVSWRVDSAGATYSGGGVFIGTYNPGSGDYDWDMPYSGSDLMFEIYGFSPINQVRTGAGNNFLLAMAEGGIFLSTDLGDSWTQSLPDSDDTTEWDKGICSGTGTYIIAKRKSDGAMYRSINGGSSWGVITPAGVDSFTLNDIAMSESGQYVIIVGKNTSNPSKSCYISSDYGATWTAKYPSSGNVEWTQCDLSKNEKLMTVAASGYPVYVSFNRGSTWVEQTIPATSEIWKGLSLSGNGGFGIVANVNNNNEVFKNSQWYTKLVIGETSISSFARALIADESEESARTTLGVGTTDSPEFVALTLSGLTGSELLATDENKKLTSLSIVDCGLSV